MNYNNEKEVFSGGALSFLFFVLYKRGQQSTVEDNNDCESMPFRLVSCVS